MRYENTDVLQSCDKHPTNPSGKNMFIDSCVKKALLYLPMYHLLVEMDSTPPWLRTKEKALRWNCVPSCATLKL